MRCANVTRPWKIGLVNNVVKLPRRGEPRAAARGRLDALLAAGFGAALVDHDRGRPEVRFLRAEAGDPLRDAFEAAGMREVATVTRRARTSSTRDSASPVADGEELYWLDWHHAGYRFDPARVDGAGPRWPGFVFPDGDYHIHLTPDLRLGTFGHPWEETICVFGDLLTRIDAELTAALGAPIRRSEP